MKKIRIALVWVSSILIVASILQLIGIFFTPKALPLSEPEDYKLLDDQLLEKEDTVLIFKPDLEALKPKDFRLWRRAGRIELRFTAGFWNKGSGPFELVSSSTAPASRDASFSVLQRLRTSEKEIIDVPVGDLFWHGVHRHYHMEDVALYTLEPLEGGEDLIHVKTSFCLTDTVAQDLKIPGASKQRVYSSACSIKKQGVSVGWADIYYYNFPGQSIDVTNLPVGDYRLTISVDPLEKYLEETRANNIETVILSINPKALRVKVITPSST